MVAHLLRLRLDILLGALRARRRTLTRTLVQLVLLVVALVAVGWGISQLEGVSGTVASAVTVIGGAAATIAFLVAPLIGGPDDPLDPRRFTVFAIAPRPLAVGVLVAGFVSVPVIALLAISLCLVLMWSAHGVPVAVGVVTVVTALLTCVLLTRVAFAIASLVLRQRRSRELTGLFFIALLVVVVPVVVFLASLEWEGRVPTQLMGAVELLALTPFGAVWALPWHWIDGDAGTSAVIALITVVALAGLWVWLARVLLTTTDRPLSSRTQRGLGWFAVTPGTPTGAVAARSLIYWLRDPRYIVNFIVVPVSAVLAMLPLLVVGVPLPVAVLVPAPLMALFLGWLAHNDLAYDSTALWMHIASAVRGYADRLGRLVPVTLISVPLLTVAVAVSVSLHGRWAILPAMVGACASLYLCGLGLSSLSSAIAPYAVSRPGDSPFEQPQRTGGALAQAYVLVGAIVLSSPTLWWGWLTLTDDAEWAWTALWGGVGIGAGVLVVGVLAGGWAYERRSGRLMEFVEST